MLHEPFNGFTGTGSTGMAFEPGTYTKLSSGRFASTALPVWKRASLI